MRLFDGSSRKINVISIFAVIFWSSCLACKLFFFRFKRLVNRCVDYYCTPSNVAHLFLGSSIVWWSENKFEITSGYTQFEAHRFMCRSNAQCMSIRWIQLRNYSIKRYDAKYSTFYWYYLHLYTIVINLIIIYFIRRCGETKTWILTN